MARRTIWCMDSAGGGLPDSRRKRDGTGRDGGYGRCALLGAVTLERAVERAAVR
jgi:hypothetical protein